MQGRCACAQTTCSYTQASKTNFYRRLLLILKPVTARILKVIATLGVLFSERHAERVKGLLDDAIAKGARVVTGGVSDIKSRYIEPTVLTDVPMDAKINHEEIFGPVLVVHTFEDLDEAIAEVNKGDKPLTLALYTGDESDKERVITRTSSGSVVINDVTIKSLQAGEKFGFGGVGASGLGRYFRESSFETFSHRKCFRYAFKNNAAYGYGRALHER